jgi:hypothetical protein
MNVHFTSCVDTTDPLDLSIFLLPLCGHASQGLPKANQKIKSNVEEKLLELLVVAKKTPKSLNFQAMSSQNTSLRIVGTSA